MTPDGPSIFIGKALPPAAVELLVEHGFLPSDPSPARLKATPSTSGHEANLHPLTAVQGQIWAALTARALNHRQVAMLEIYWRARLAGEPALSVNEAGRRLAEALSVPHGEACNFAKGALRSFGRRLAQTLQRPPANLGNDNPGAANEIPLLALLAIETGPHGESRHRLTYDGMTAVAAALGLTAHGAAATGVSTADSAIDDLDEVVLLGMSRLSAAVLLRAQRSMCLSLDATIKAMAARAGAG